MSDLIAQFAAILDQASAAGVGSTELLVRQLGSEGELIRRCAITHQFTPEVLCALDPSLDRASAEQAFHRLARLSLVIRSPDGLALHDRAREELFAGWLAPAKLELLREISTRLIAYLDPLVKAAGGAEQEKLIRRRLFHLIAVDQDAGIDAFEEAFEESLLFRIVTRGARKLGLMQKRVACQDRLASHDLLQKAVRFGRIAAPHQDACE